MPKKIPPEFKRDFVAVARRRTVDLSEVAADFDVSESALRRWMRQTGIHDCIKGGLTTAEQARIGENVSTAEIARCSAGARTFS